MQSYNPNNALTLLVWAVPFSLATTGGITIVFFSTGYLDVSVLRVGVHIVQSFFKWLGFPIRKSSDKRLFAPTRSLSQLITSFIASESQGIHRVPLLTFVRILLVTFYFLSICQRTYPCKQGTVENNGFEPLTPCVQGRCSSQLS